MEIVEIAIYYLSGTRWCNVCLTEKLLIAKSEPKTLWKKQLKAIW